MREQTIAEAIFEEGWIKGYAAGELRITRLYLKRLLEQRFGPLPDPIIRDLETCEDIGRLNVAFKAVLHLDKLEDFRL